MNHRLFDQGFFSTRAEGNLPMSPDSYLQHGTARDGGDYSWSRPRLPRTSILSGNQRAITLPAMPNPTLNSFSAFAEGEIMGSDGVLYGPDDTVPSGVTLTGVTQPASVKGNNLTDAVSGIIKAFTPVAQAAVNRQTSTNLNAALIQQYLQGKLPGYTLNTQTGQLQKSSPIITIAIIGGAALILLMVARR